MNSAFPHAYNTGSSQVNPGLSKREFFAAMAIAGMAPADTFGNGYAITARAEAAVLLADALIVALTP